MKKFNHFKESYMLYVAMFLFFTTGYQPVKSQNQSDLSWQAWGFSNKVGKIVVGPTDYFLATSFGVVKIKKANPTGSKNYINKLTSNFNLTSNYITSIALDNNGNPIISNEGSVHINNGNTWQNMITNVGNTPNFFIEDIFYDTDGSIWVAAGGTGVHRYHGNTWTSFNASNSTVGTWVRKIFRHQNKLYFCTNFNGLAWYDGTSWGRYTTSNSGIPCDSYLNDATFDSQGNLWIACDAGLSRFDGNTWTVYNTQNTPVFQSNSIRAIAFINNKLYVSPSGQLCSFDGSTWTDLTSSLPLGAFQISSLASDGNKLLIGTQYRGLFIYENNNTTHVPLSNCGLKSFNPNGLAIDPMDGKIYVSEEYVTTFDGTNWGDLNGNGWGPASFASGGLAVRNGILYGIANDGLYKYQNTWSKLETGNIDALFFIQVMLGANNQLWIRSSQQGIIKYDGTNFTAYPINNPKIPALNNLTQAPDGSIWSGVFMRNYLVKFNGTTYTIYDSLMHGFVPMLNSISSVAIASDTVFYCATNVGLWKYNPATKVWKQFSSSNSPLPTDDVRGVRVNVNGDIWVYTFVNSRTFKLSRIRNGEWMHFDIKDTPMDIHPVGMEFDPSGNLWLIGNGIYKLSDASIQVSNEKLFNKLSEVKIYPNPAMGDEIQIHSPMYAEAWIYDLNGKLCYSKHLEAGNNMLKTQLKPGVYLVKTSLSNKTQKIIVQ